MNNPRFSLQRCALLVVLGFAATSFGQSDPAVVAKIIDEGKNKSKVMKYLRELTKDVGSRLTSSTRLDKGNEWAIRKFKAMGIQNVRLEQWGEWPVGFDRGKNNVGRMVSPFESEFHFTTPSWSQGTRGLVRGPAVMGPSDMDSFNKMKSKLKGAWVVYATAPGRNATATDVDNAVLEAGIAGRVYGSRNELVITSGNFRDKTYEKHPMDVRVTVRKSDMERIMRNIEYGRDVQLEFNLQNKWVKGPRKLYNVIAEIPGTEKPDEVVIVSGHFDSWDGPNSEGALDNGTGSCTAIEAARILMKVKAKPKRTIRFILWSGEEQGLFGSREYVKLHEKEMDKISAVLVDDGGTNYQGGYVGIASQKEIMEAAFAPVNAAFPELPQKFEVRERMPRGGGSDHASFNAVGVPGFFTMETGRSDYNFVHHTQHDTLEYAIPEYLVQSATNHAVVSFYLANLPDLLPRDPKPAPAPATPPTP